MTFGGQSPDMLAIRLRGPCRVGGGRERFEVGEDAALPFGCGRGAAILPADGQAQAVEHAARLLGRLTDDLGDALAERDAAPLGARASRIDRKSVVSGKGGSGRVDSGGRLILKRTNTCHTSDTTIHQ